MELKNNWLIITLAVVAGIYIWKQQQNKASPSDPAGQGKL
jgi:hypothetical protein